MDIINRNPTLIILVAVLTILGFILSIYIISRLFLELKQDVIPRGSFCGLWGHYRF